MGCEFCKVSSWPSVRRHGWFLLDRGITRVSWLQAVEPADVRRARERPIENFDNDHAASATRTWRQLVVGAGWSIVIIIAMDRR